MKKSRSKCWFYSYMQVLHVHVHVCFINEFNIVLTYFIGKMYEHFLRKKFYMYICTDFFCQFILLHNRLICFVHLHQTKYDKSVYLIIIFPLDRKVCDTLSNIWSWYFSTSFWCQSSLHFWEKNMFLKLYTKHSSLVTKKPWPIDNHWKYNLS